MQRLKILTRPYWHRKYVKFLEAVHSKNLPFEKTKELYYTMTGKWLDYSHPTDINQKLMWLTRYWRHPLKTKCADKYLVRDYVKGVGLGKILIPLVGAWDRADDIPFDDLPDQFVLSSMKSITRMCLAKLFAKGISERAASLRRSISSGASTESRNRSWPVGRIWTRLTMPSLTL